MKSRSAPKIIFGVLILVFGWVFITIVALLTTTAFFGDDEPSVGMVIGASVYALIVTFIGRWVSKTGEFTVIYSGAAAIMPAAIIVEFGWPMLEEGLIGSARSVKQETESE